MSFKDIDEMDLFNEFEKKSIIYELSDYQVAFNQEDARSSNSILVKKNDKDSVKMFSLFEVNFELDIRKKSCGEIVNEVREAFDE